MKRASMNLGAEGSPQDIAELRIENDRLKTTLMILNQKMKMQEDNEDLNEKWKGQVQAKDGQISIMNDQIDSMQAETDKQRAKIRELSSQVASLESSLQATESSKKQLQSNYDILEDEKTSTKNNYNKLFS
jgi:chromosome segregation ATPase